MKLTQLKEVRYAGSLEAEDVLYTLWKKRNQIEKDNLSVVKIDDPALSKKRAAAVARYAVRVIAPEALDAIGMTEEAQKLRDLPPDVDLYDARDAARDAARVVDHDAVRDAVRDAAYAADAIDYRYAIAAGDAAYYAARAAFFASEITNNKQRYLYHLNQMIKIAANIK